MTAAVPVPYRARVLVDGAAVADTTGAVRVDAAGERPPELWFPDADVQVVDERWRAGEGALAGRLCPDPERLHVELVDGRPGDDARDVTTKRFPCWGDAADLVALLDVQPTGDGRWVGGTHTDGVRPVVEGSQLLGEAVVAASRTHPGRRVVSAWMAFTRAADARRPVAVELYEVAEGRTFAAAAARVVQDGRTCAAGSLLLDVGAPDVVRHAAAPPDVVGPYEAVPFDMGVTGRDLRVVDAAYTGDPDAPVGPPALDVWVRFRELPDDRALHAGLVAQLTGHFPIAAALRAHAGIGQDQAHRTLSTAINAIQLSFHADVRADQWLLYHHESTFGGDGMTHAECRVHTEAGDLVASFVVDAMVRGFADPEAAVDHHTAR